MGEANRRKALAVSDVVLAGQQRQWLYTALRKVINAYEPNPSASCTATAQVGALVLNQLGVRSARAVAGSALWRVGPGDGDVVVHALECMPAGSGLHHSELSSGKSVGMFHAWITVGAQTSELVDFTTYSLRAKAALLDKADGKYTQVDWCPDFLWIEATQAIPLDSVIASYSSGVFGYRQHQGIQNQVLRANADALREMADNVLTIYGLLGSGQANENSMVMTMDESGRVVSDEMAMADLNDSNPITKII